MPEGDEGLDFASTRGEVLQSVVRLWAVLFVGWSASRNGKTDMEAVKEATRQTCVGMSLSKFALAPACAACDPFGQQILGCVAILNAVRSRGLERKY